MNSERVSVKSKWSGSLSVHAGVKNKRAGALKRRAGVKSERAGAKMSKRAQEASGWV